MVLRITIPKKEYWDETKLEFVSTDEQTLDLEHSLVSLSKWESKWCKPFLTKDVKTLEETIDYIRCMTLTENVDPSVYNSLTDRNIEEVNKYIEAPMTATWFNKDATSGGGGAGEQSTSETIYYQMTVLTIPFECENWHLNRLLTLIRVCNEKSKPPKQMSKRDRLSQNRSLNNARRKRLNTRG